MSMRKLSFLLGCLLIISQALALEVSFTLVEPEVYPFESNQATTITLSAYNMDANTANDLSIGIDVQYPFKAASGESYEKIIGDLAAHTSVNKDFRLVTYDNVEAGDYVLKTYYCSSPCTYKQYVNLGVRFTASGDVEIVSYEFEDELLVPGEKNVLNVTLKNEGLAEANDVKLIITNEYDNQKHFVFLDKSNQYFIGDMNIGEIVSVPFEIKVSEDLSSGVYVLPVSVEFDGETHDLGEISFEVVNAADLSLTYSFGDDNLYPGLNTNLAITLVNEGSAKSKNLKLNLTGVGDYFILTDLPNYYRIGDLDVGESVTVNYDIVLNKELSPGVVSVPVYVDYGLGSSSLVGSIIFEVISKADVNIALVETDPVTPIKGESFTVMTTVENVGFGKAKSTIVEIVGDVTGTTTSYLGVLDKDEDDVAMMDVIPGKDTSYTIKVTYTDDLGIHEVSRDVSFVFSRPPIKKSYWWWLFSLLVILVVGYLWKTKRLRVKLHLHKETRKH